MKQRGEESFMKFLALLKHAGVGINNENELRERLAEVKSWRYAFETLASNGHLLGISFHERGERARDEDIHRAFVQFRFPENFGMAFTERLRSGCPN
jgi:hypothetical protein